MTALPLCSTPAAAAQTVPAAVQPMFGRMFPDLPAYDAPSDAALTALTCGQDPTLPSPLCTLQTQVLPTGPKMGPLFDQNIAAPTVPNNDNSVYSGTSTVPDPSQDVPSFFTYFGQFLDHDMTLDKLPLPTEFVDPNTIPNSRDRPRDPSCVVPTLSVSTLTPCPAIINEGRNDENQVIAQIHVAFVRAHNALIDQGNNLEHARELMRWRHQWIFVHEFLPEVLDANVYRDVFRPDGSIHTKYYDPKQAFRATMPVEFAVAAYRFGHSQVRKAYIMTQGGAKLQVFNNFIAQDLHGGRQIATDHVIFWPNFPPVDGQPSTGQPQTGQVAANISRKIDTLLSSGLFGLPIPGAEPEGSAILNTARGRLYRACTAQTLAAARSPSAPTTAHTSGPLAVTVGESTSGRRLFARTECRTPPPRVS